MRRNPRHRTAAKVGTWLTIGVLASSMPMFAGAAAAQPDCSITLQSMVDDASPGEVISVPACLYRETVVVDQPVSLIAQPGAEIRSSDIWPADRWEALPNGTWRSFDTLRTMYTRIDHERVCADQQRLCVLPEQVFVNGDPLAQIIDDGTSPTGSQFMVDEERRITVAVDPTPEATTIEVTTRFHWIEGLDNVDDVTISGFTMKHGSRHAQGGGGIKLRITSANWRIENNQMSDTHGDVLQISGRDHTVIDNDIFNGGWVGINGGDPQSCSVSDDPCDDGGHSIVNNRVFNNTIGGFNYRWAGGGMKLIAWEDAVVKGNHVFDNIGPGIWCDIECRNVTIAANCAWGNAGSGIFFEISSGAEIRDNVVFQNGWDYSPWGWGAGILVSGASSADSTYSDAEVYNNTVAWNADGITLVRPGDRNEEHRHTTPQQNFVHDNVIIMDPVINPDDGDTSNYAFAWLQANQTITENVEVNGDIWTPTTINQVMFLPQANNRGANNRYWINPDYSGISFAWENRYTTDQLDSFSATPGESNATTMSDAELSAEIAEHGLPSNRSAADHDCQTAPGDSVVAGDVNCDDVVDDADALLVTQWRVALVSSVSTCPSGDAIMIAACDLSDDGTCDTADALLMAGQ